MLIPYLPPLDATQWSGGHRGPRTLVFDFNHTKCSLCSGSQSVGHAPIVGNTDMTHGAQRRSFVLNYDCIITI